MCRAQNNRYLMDSQIKKMIFAKNSCIPIGSSQDVYDNFRCIEYSNYPCQAWSFDLAEQKCYLATNVSDYQIENNLYKKYDFASAVTGKFDCLPSVANTEIFAKMKTETINLNNYCLFSPVRFSELGFYSKCSDRHDEIARPLFTLKQEVDFFQTNFLNKYSFNDVGRQKRSVAFAIFSILRTLAMEVGVSIVKNFIDGLGISRGDIMGLAFKKFKRGGVSPLFVQKRLKLQKNMTFDCKAISEYFDELQKMSIIGNVKNKLGLGWGQP